MRIFGRTPCERSEPSPVSECETDDSVAQSVTATSAKKIQDIFCMNEAIGRELLVLLSVQKYIENKQKFKVPVILFVKVGVGLYSKIIIKDI